MKPVKKGVVKSKVKRGDQVVFIAGKEYNRYDSAGKRQPFRGRVIEVDARNGKVRVEGAAIVKRHQKPVPQLNREGGIIENEGWVNISNVAVVDPESRCLHVARRLRPLDPLSARELAHQVGRRPRQER